MDVYRIDGWKDGRMETWMDHDDDELGFERMSSLYIHSILTWHDECEWRQTVSREKVARSDVHGMDTLLDCHWQWHLAR